MLTLCVEALPPSVNHIYCAGRGGSRHLSAPARAWYDLAVPTLRLAACGASVPSQTPLRLRIEVCGLARTTDMDNIAKASIDALAQALNFDDRWIDDLRLTRAKWRKGEPKCTRYFLEVLS